MSVTIDLCNDEIAQIRSLTDHKNESEAVAHAVREFLRVSTLRELKDASGKVDYHDSGHEMEVLELRERRSGQ